MFAVSKYPVIRHRVSVSQYCFLCIVRFTWAKSQPVQESIVCFGRKPCQDRPVFSVLVSDEYIHAYHCPSLISWYDKGNHMTTIFIQLSGLTWLYAAMEKQVLLITSCHMTRGYFIRIFRHSLATNGILVLIRRELLWYTGYKGIRHHHSLSHVSAQNICLAWYKTAIILVHAQSRSFNLALQT